MRLLLDTLGRYGMIPGRFPFLLRIANTYGKSVLLDSQLKWIPVTQRTGDLIHLNKEALVDQLSEEGRLLLCFGCSPNACYAYASADISLRELQKTLLIAFTVGKLGMEYALRDELKREHPRCEIKGPVEELLSTIHATALPRFAQALVSIVAEAWHMEERELHRQDWHFNFEEYDRYVLWVDLRRATVVQHERRVSQD
jgi:hypothetical protein